MGWCGSNHLSAYSIMVSSKALDKMIMCFQTGAPWEVSSCRPKYLTRTTTEHFPAQEGFGVQWNLSVPLAVRMMDIRCDAQKTPTHIWTHTYMWRHRKKRPTLFHWPRYFSKVLCRFYTLLQTSACSLLRYRPEDFMSFWSRCCLCSPIT